MNEIRDELRQDFQDREYAHTYVEDFLNAEIATQIKVLREQRDLTQQQLADLAGMAQSRISILEDVNYGSWSIKTLKALARAFDVTLKVSFESFGSRIGDIVNFNRRALQRTSRTEELAKNGESELPASVTDLFEWQKNRNRLQTPDLSGASSNMQTLDSNLQIVSKESTLLAAQKRA